MSFSDLEPVKWLISILIWIPYMDEKNSVDPDKLASDEASRSGSTLFLMA